MTVIWHGSCQRHVTDTFCLNLAVQNSHLQTKRRLVINPTNAAYSNYILQFLSSFLFSFRQFQVALTIKHEKFLTVSSCLFCYWTCSEWWTVDLWSRWMLRLRTGQQEARRKSRGQIYGCSDRGHRVSWCERTGSRGQALMETTDCLRPPLRGTIQRRRTFL